MSKRDYRKPFLMSGPIQPGDDGELTGPGSGQSGFEPYACTFDEWLVMFADSWIDADPSHRATHDDYLEWLKAYNFEEP